MKPLNPLHRLIREATDAAADDMARIENIMREEIFHSTLDWQTREQLADAAREDPGTHRREGSASQYERQRSGHHGRSVLCRRAFVVNSNHRVADSAESYADADHRNKQLDQFYNAVVRGCQIRRVQRNHQQSDCAAHKVATKVNRR